MSVGAPSSLSIARYAKGTDPAANAEISEVVPSGKAWLLLGLSVPLVQGATQTPQPVLQIATAHDAVDEVQILTLDAIPAGGTAKLRFTPPESYQPGGAGPFTTAPIAGTGNITAAELQAALRLLPGLEALTVAGSDGGPYTITFTGGAFGGIDVPLLEVVENTITPATAFAFTQDTVGVQGGVVFESFGSSAAQAVSTTCRYSWGVGLPLTGQVGLTTGVRSTAPLPAGLLLGPGYRIRTITVGKGANSDYGAPALHVVEYG